ncbi:UNVERIFIED_CONTAM: hypothetical protein RMT77_010475 [Armadillidium vulgare]
MRIFLIAFLASLALWGTPTRGAEAPVHINVPVVKVPVQVIHEAPVDEEVIEVNDEDDIDVKRMFQDLFFYEYDEEKKIAEREGKQLEEEDEEEVQTRQSVSDPQVISKCNGFIDAFLNRLGDEMRSNHDPMRLIIRQSGQIDAENGAKIKTNKKNRNTKKGAKKGRVHPKDVSAVTGEEGAENEELDSDRSKREIVPEAEENLDDYEYYDDEELDDYEDLEGRALDTESDLAYDDEYDYEDYEEYEDDEQGLQETREGKSLTEPEETKSQEDGNGSELVEGRRRGPRQRRRRRRKGGRGRRRRKCGKFCQRRRRRLRRRKLRNRRRGRRSVKAEVPTAVISGISNIKRVGDVRVFERENSQDIVADFGVGPVVLRAQKSYGKGSQKEIREAEAIAARVMGEVVVNVSRRGDAKVKRMRLLRPSDIQVSGTLRRKQSLKSDKAMESFVRRTRPAVSRTMKQAATRIFRIAKNSSKNINNFNI